jgi:hypothetical protein
MADQKVMLAIREENVALILEGLETLKESVARDCTENKGCAACIAKWTVTDGLIKSILAAAPIIEYAKE